MKKTKFLLFIIAGVIIIGVSFYFYKNYFGNSKSNIGGVENSDSTLIYNNIEMGFTLEYPKELTYKDFDEGDTTHTIVFSEVNTDRGFQIFFTPYYGDQITQSRIMKDVPGGKFTKPVDVIIGGSIRALVFYSTLDMGEMTEVWFLYKGYLYQFTAPVEHEEWLSKIMESLKFIPKSTAGGTL